MWPSEYWAAKLYDWANWGLIVGLVIGVISTLVVVWMGNVKEVYLRKDLAATTERAANADERAADAEQGAAEANRIAEAEKLARLKIEKQLAPRTLSEADRGKIAEDLHGFAASLAGRKVRISSLVGDAEGIVFSLEIMDIVTRAGIEVDPIIGRVQQVGLVDLGVQVTGPAADQEFMKRLATDIRADCDTALSVEWGPQFTAVEVAVRVKPVAGLPTVVRPGASHQ
jgi:hypothetical protein